MTAEELQRWAAIGLAGLGFAKALGWVVTKTLTTYYDVNVKPTIVDFQKSLDENVRVTEENTVQLAKAEQAAIAMQHENAKAFSDIHAILANHDSRITFAERVLDIPPNDAARPFRRPSL